MNPTKDGHSSGTTTTLQSVKYCRDIHDEPPQHSMGKVSAHVGVVAGKEQGICSGPSFEIYINIEDHENTRNLMMEC